MKKKYILVQEILGLKYVLKKRKTYLDVCALAVRTVLEDELLQVKESPLVIHPLPDLHDRCPCVVCECRGAVIALLVPDDEGNDHCLLQDSPVPNLFLDGELKLQTPTMGFCPDPRSIHQLHLLKAVDLLACGGY